VIEEGVKILVVEDEMIVGEFICHCLGKIGHRVCGVADNFEEALELVEDEQPDLILMDIELGGDKTGIDAATEIHEKWDIPVIYLTAYSDDQTLSKAKQSKPFGYITKPFTENDIKIAVMMALEHVCSESNIIELGESYLYEPEQQQLCLNEKPVLLTKKERLLLHKLIMQRNQVVPYQVIESCLWEDVIVSESSLRALMLRIRKKLPGLSIQNVSGIGYLLSTP